MCHLYFFSILRSFHWLNLYFHVIEYVYYSSFHKQQKQLKWHDEYLCMKIVLFLFIIIEIAFLKYATF